MNNQKPKNRQLKKLLINPKFQLSVILYATSLSLILNFIQFLAMKNFFSKYYREGTGIGLQKEHPFFKFLEDQEIYMNRVFLVTSVVVFVVTVLSGLILSHRVAGPLHRLKKYLGGVKSGEATTKLSFRQGDFFQDIPPVVNEALEHTQSK